MGVDMNTKKVQYTPAPWRVGIDDTSAYGSGYPVIMSDTYRVVGAEGMFGDIEQDMANAHLIAAAPELYESLAEMYALFESIGTPGEHTWTIEMQDRAKQALKKARGES